MDRYHSVHGHDVSSFDLVATHRLPTVSAAAALDELTTDPSRFISTGLGGIDRVLNDAGDEASRNLTVPGGFQRGQVVEVWGPPGSGKTSLGLQLSTSALRHGDEVTWVDAFHPICAERLPVLAKGIQANETEPPRDVLETGFRHFTCSSLAHFVALLCRPTVSCVSNRTSLIVVDSLSALVNQSFPRNHEPRKIGKGGSSTSTRRLQMLRSIISSLQKLAATRDALIVLLTQCATRMQAERGAALIPAINAGFWDHGIATRLVLFREWVVKSDKAVGLRLARVQKLNGKAYQDGLGPISAFDIGTRGIVPVEHDESQSTFSLTVSGQYKRKLGNTDFEIADSEDEDYGWEEDDSAQLPAMPPQWQGSEDLLLGHRDDEGNDLVEASDNELHQDNDAPHEETITKPATH